MFNTVDTNILYDKRNTQFSNSFAENYEKRKLEIEQEKDPIKKQIMENKLALGILN